MTRFIPIRTVAVCLALWTSAATSTAAPEAPAGQVQVLAHFDPGVCQVPSSPLIQAADGNLYGTFSVGGSQHGGCLYRVTPKGKLTIVREFSYDPGEGAIPYGGLQLLPDGSLLGSTQSGGPGAIGTVFRMTTDGSFSYLRKFGQDPLGYLGTSGAPVRASDGRLYGHVGGGGPTSGGAVYSMAEDGTDLRILHRFSRTAGEIYGGAGMLTAGSDGALYGALVSGPNEGGGAGGIFRLEPGGNYQVLHTMNAVDDGVDPQGGVIQLADGSLYGTNSSFGGDGNWGSRGTIFRLSQSKSGDDLTRFKVLYTGSEFGGGPNTFPAGLTPVADGSFWTVSTFGGAFDQGTVFRFAKGGQVQTLHAFSGADGSYPHWRLTPGTDGWLYGVTQQGGKLGGGVVFRIKAP